MTLVEILIVFVLFAAVAAISVPSVGDTLRRDRVSKIGAVLSSDIEQAFAIAARQREPVRMVVDRANKRFSIQSRNVATPTVYKTRSLSTSGEYGVDSLWTNRDTIDIMPNGMATDTLRLALIIRTRGGTTYEKAVRVSKGGLVRMDNR